MTFVIGLVILVAAIATAVVYGAMRNKRAFAKQNEIVAGTPSRAPAAWAGAHSPEALLHRRLRGAVDASRAQLAVGSGVEDVVAAIARGAQEADDRLIAAAALPAPQRTAAIAAVEPSVVALENAVAGLLSNRSATDQNAVTAAVAEAHDRLDALAAARAEVDEADIARPRPAQTQPPLESQPESQPEPQSQPRPADPPR